MKDLNCVTKEEQKLFFESFEQVLCDVDGVLWHFPDLIPNADAAIASLKKINKKVIFVSNKTSTSHDAYHQRLKFSGFEISHNDLIMPEVAIINHLKKIRFNREIYLIGMVPLRNALIKAGFKVAPCVPHTEESMHTFVKSSLEKSDNIGAVITDIDVNMTYLKLQKAAIYLLNPEVLFITANSLSCYLNAGVEDEILNSVHFDNALEDFTGRKALRLAKPSVQYNDFVKEQHELGDSSKVLFVGDSIEDDMAFATNCGYKKLLVLSGMVQKEAIIDWSFPEEYKPEYYIDSLTTLQEILHKIQNKN